MSDIENTTGETRGRPRVPSLGDRILTATRALLVEQGYAGMTLDGVAAAAGCGKSAIYRRFDGKAQLVVAAVKQLQAPWPVPDTGSLRDDLLACAMHYARADEQASAVLARLLAELGRDPELYDVAYQTIGRPPVAALISVIDRAKERGDARDDAPTELIAGIVPSVAFGSVTLQGRSLEPATIERLVDDVLLPALTAAAS